MSVLEAKVEQRSGAQVVIVTGEADATSVDPLDRALKLAADAKPRLAVLDLCGLSFISSLGMGALARFSRDMKPHGRVKIVLPPGHVRDVMTRSRVIELFEEAASVEDAVTA